MSATPAPSDPSARTSSQQRVLLTGAAIMIDRGNTRR
jgi:hypothetical protein